VTGTVEPVTFGSLFAGVGGFDLGFEQAGWECRWQVEWDQKCQSVLAYRWPNVTRHGDVRDVGVIPLAGRPNNERDGLRPQPNVDGRESSRNLLAPVDCITYGFPCQDLSVAGKRAGLDGDRSNLFFEAVRIIEEMRDATGGRYPTFAVAENVPGLLSADGGDAMGRCLDALADIGAVAIEWAVLDAQHFGVPQRRRRVFLVAVFDPGVADRGEILPVRESCGGHSAPGREAGPDAADSSSRSVDAARGFGSVSDEGIAQALLTPSGGVCVPEAQAGHLIPFVKARRAQSVDDDETWEAGRPAPRLNAFDNGSESRATVLAMSDVSASVTAKWAKGSGGPAGDECQNLTVATDAVRRLTPRECERLMGWPDDHTRWGADGKELADTNRYRMCGNGVVAPVARWVAERLNDVFRDAG
jgi:DNA (cytosine-5)-methyltransferase 1